MKLPAGKALTLEEAEEFIKSRKERGKFNGLAEMHGAIQGGEYKVRLLMTDGEVAAMEITGTCEEPVTGDEALGEMKKLCGSEGDLKLVSFRGEDMDKIRQENSEALLKKTVMLEDFNIRIKPPMKQQQEGGGMLETVKSLFSQGTHTSKTEFKGRFRLDEEKPREEGMPDGDGPYEAKKKTTSPREGGEGPKAKQDLIGRIKSRRFGRITETLLARRRTEEPTDAPPEEKKVETSIDRLFNLLDKRDKLRINDGLAKELGVTKERVEEWAVILEEHNLVSINYPAIGEPEITKKKR